MACCPCFKTAVTDDRDEKSRRQSGTRNSIRKDKNEQDLLDLNARGMIGAGGDEWNDPKSGRNESDDDSKLRVSKLEDGQLNRQNTDSKVNNTLLL